MERKESGAELNGVQSCEAGLRRAESATACISDDSLAEAAKLINRIKPAVVVPIHYGSVVGSEEDAKNFKCLLNSNIICEIKM